ncbi:hypothetical protein TNCV_312101 [Trichonephila clavipes]|nr:hypothetical protein TNCV_312101 [Trichonephila clavipes]
MNKSLSGDLSFHHPCITFDMYSQRLYVNNPFKHAISENDIPRRLAITICPLSKSEKSAAFLMLRNTLCVKRNEKRKLDWTGASEMNRLYPNSRRESSNENKYLNTLPRRGGGWRKKRPNENETQVRHEGRNGRAQGRGA